MSWKPTWSELRRKEYGYNIPTEASAFIPRSPSNVQEWELISNNEPNVHTSESMEYITFSCATYEQQNMFL